MVLIKKKKSDSHAIENTYSQTAPALNLQVAESQQALLCPPVSHSSPSSLIPLPHIFKVVTFLVPGSIFNF